MQKTSIMSIETIQEAVIELTDLVARCYQLEYDLEDLKARLLSELEQSVKS